MAELEIFLIRARSPQAKGRVERSFGTAQDRCVKEMRLAKVKTLAQPTRCWSGCRRSTIGDSACLPYYLLSLDSFAARAICVILPRAKYISHVEI